MYTKFLLIMIIALEIISCSKQTVKTKTTDTTKTQNIATPQEKPSSEAKLLAKKQETTFMSEFSFKKGKSELSSSSKKQLNAINKKALEKGKIEIIKVITWADQEYPTAIKNNLSQDQQLLVEKRNEKIKKYLQKIASNTIHDIELISMPQRPSFLKNLLSSDDAKIKRDLESAGISDTETSSIKGSKKSKSIVLFLVKSEQTK